MICDGIVWSFQTSRIGLGFDGSPSGRTIDPGMNLLQTISYLTHQNIVRLGADASDELQWIEL